MTQKSSFLLAAAMLAVLLTACEDQSARAELEKVRSDLEALQNTAGGDGKTTRLENLEAEVAGLQAGFKSLVRQAEEEKRAAIDPTAKGYAFVESAAGRLVVACKGAEPYLEGHKILLRVGNPLLISFTGFKCSVRFGKRPPTYPVEEKGVISDAKLAEISKWTAEFNEWEKSLKLQGVTFTETLEPGQWTDVNFVLSPSKPEEVAYMDVQLITDRIGLKSAGPK